MKIRLGCKHANGLIHPTPDALSTVIAIACDGHIHLSTQDNIYRLVYGLESQDFKSLAKAMNGFKFNVQHYVETGHVPDQHLQTVDYS